MNRLLTVLPLAALLSLAVAAPVGAREFGTIYAEGDAYRTFGNPARVDPGTGTDPIVAFTNFDQGGVAQYAPARDRMAVVGRCGWRHGSNRLTRTC